MRRSQSSTSLSSPQEARTWLDGCHRTVLTGSVQKAGKTRSSVEQRYVMVITWLLLVQGRTRVPGEGGEQLRLPRVTFPIGAADREHGPESDAI